MLGDVFFESNSPSDNRLVIFFHLGFDCLCFRRLNHIAKLKNRDDINSLSPRNHSAELVRSARDYPYQTVYDLHRARCCDQGGRAYAEREAGLYQELLRTVGDPEKGKRVAKKAQTARLSAIKVWLHAVRQLFNTSRAGRTRRMARVWRFKDGQLAVVHIFVTAKVIGIIVVR